MTNAYAFARQNGLTLPAGLIAFRSMGNAPDARMIGAYKFESEGRSGSTYGSEYGAPAVIVVMSTAAGNAVEVVVGAKDYRTGSGARWQFVTAAKSENRIAFPNLDESRQWEFTWRDQNSGTFSSIPKGNQTSWGGRGHGRPSAFTRLDG